MAEGPDLDGRPIEAVLTSIRRVLDAELAAKAALNTGGTRPGQPAVPPSRPEQAPVAPPASDQAVQRWLDANLRPMLAAWMDRNLPDILEPLIREEIRKMIGGADRDPR